MRWNHEIKKHNRKAKKSMLLREKIRAKYKKSFIEPLRLMLKTEFSPDVLPKLLNEEHTIISSRFTINWVKFLMGPAYMLLNERPHTMAMAFFTERSSLRLFRRPFARRNPLFYYFFLIVCKLKLWFLYNSRLLLVDLRYITYVYFFEDFPKTLDINHFLKRRFVKLVRFSHSNFNFELNAFFLARTYVWFLHVFTYNEQLFNNDAKHIGYNFYCAPSTGPEDNGALWAVERWFYRSIMFRNINLYKLWSYKYKQTEYHNISFSYHMLGSFNYMTFFRGFYSVPLLRRRTYQAFWPKTSMYFPYHLYLVFNKFRVFNRRWARSFGSLKKLHYNRLAFHFEYFGPSFVEQWLWKHGRKSMALDFYKSPKTAIYFMLEPFSIEDLEGYYQRCPSVIAYFYIFGYIDYIDTYFFHDFTAEVHECPLETMTAIYRYLLFDIVEILIAEGDGLYEELVKSYNWNIHDSFSALAYNDEPSTFPALSFPEEHWKLHTFRQTRALDLANEFRSFRFLSGHYLELRYYMTYINCLQDFVLSILYRKRIRLSNAEAFEVKVLLYRYFKFRFTWTRCHKSFNHFINNHKWHFFIP